MFPFDMTECPHCHGSGMNRDSTVCKECGGLGQVPK